MKILVTGANGQLGSELVLSQDSVHELIGFSRSQMDVTNLEEVRHVIRSVNPHVIVHCAAYTAVDNAESDQDQAYLVNAYGSRNIAIAAEETRAKICYISTDYVFNGNGALPYKEYDNTDPQSVYGKSKRAGEQLVQTLASKYFIVRTSWVYGVNGKNFVKTILEKAKELPSVRVVNDQVGSPTYTRDLARFLIELVATDKYGVYHASNQGACSWYEFAQAIFEETGASTRLEPCRTEEFARRAPRPRYSVLDNMSVRTNGFAPLRQWREALKDFLSDYRLTSNP